MRAMPRSLRSSARLNAIDCSASPAATLRKGPAAVRDRGNLSGHIRAQDRTGAQFSVVADEAHIVLRGGRFLYLKARCKAREQSLRSPYDRGGDRRIVRRRKPGGGAHARKASGSRAKRLP